MRPVRQRAAPRVTCTQTSTGRSPVHTSTVHRALTASTWAWVVEELQPIAGSHTRVLTGQRPSPVHGPQPCLRTRGLAMPARLGCLETRGVARDGAAAHKRPLQRCHGSTAGSHT
jgi:hypothetical protein